MVKLMHWTVHADRAGEDQKISLDKVDPPRCGLRPDRGRSASLQLLDRTGAMVKAR